VNLAIVGGGPSGLRAAEILAEAGATVTLVEGKASVGRKFLVAGRGGLNLTHSESLEDFSKRYKGGFSDAFWTSLLEDCTPLELRKWAESLGIDTFIGTSGRVFPKEFKAAPLLRRWVENLRSRKVIIQTRQDLQSIKKEDGRILLELSGNNGVKESAFDAVILALGGASWPETGWESPSHPSKPPIADGKLTGIRTY
jgi:predicted Rossmann fold flavoprotein